MHSPNERAYRFVEPSTGQIGAHLVRSPEQRSAVLLATAQIGFHLEANQLRITRPTNWGHDDPRTWTGTKCSSIVPWSSLLARCAGALGGTLARSDGMWFVRTVEVVSARMGSVGPIRRH
jgi:hypothetical protein